MQLQHVVGTVITVLSLVSAGLAHNIDRRRPRIPSPPLPPPSQQRQGQQQEEEAGGQQQEQQRQQQNQPCPDPEAPKSFALHDIAYLRYTVSGPAPSPQPNTTQLVFELVNENTGVSTGCACQDVMDEDGGWADGDGRNWYACLDRAAAAASDDEPVRTRVRVDWDDWRLTVNQTWVCDESVTTNQFSILTLKPTCTENTSGPQYIKECTAPDIVVSATSEGSMVPRAR